MQTNDYFIAINAQQNLDVILPSASTLFNGQIFVIKDESGDAQNFTLKIKAPDGQLIDGQAEISLVSPYSGVSIYTDGNSNFFLF